MEAYDTIVKTVVVLVKTVTVIIKRILGYIDRDAVAAFMRQIVRTAQDMFSDLLSSLNKPQFSAA